MVSFFRSMDKSFLLYYRSSADLLVAPMIIMCNIWILHLNTWKCLWSATMAYAAHPCTGKTSFYFGLLFFFFLFLWGESLNPSTLCHHTAEVPVNFLFGLCVSVACCSFFPFPYTTATYASTLLTVRCELFNVLKFLVHFFC